ncbi:FKBP-type peptidyl-prolyl cis-trans isomerase [Nocardioides dongkuii]|uniref:FKBP-type peptidyl-prolyl cis-trans isomerase n=1 Tax=Nocardioides dongkuii TaxID=2760089 RepID=UPI0018789C58|nr:FKBP-type peptidyl-prolyl cis-trans isomerase [Nocardioides dongkuii]
MLPRLHRPLAALVPVLLLGLTACGDDDGTSPNAIDGLAGFDAVEISGEPGSKPTVTWKDQLEADDPEVEVLTEGDGEEVAAGDSVLANLWIGNGFSQEETYTTYGEGGAQELVLDEEQLAPIFLEALEGQTRGSRVAVVASAEEAFGEAGNPSLGIGNQDTVLMVVDLAPAPLAAPQGAKQQRAAWMPRLTAAKGAITGFDFTGTPEPTAKLQQGFLIKGDGPVVEKGQAITVDYLGQVYGGAKPFDESYSKEPTSFPIGTGGVIKGWDRALAGVPVGSRVVLAVPPDLGYGTEGNKQAGIKGTDTLYFVVDVLGAA